MFAARRLRLIPPLSSLIAGIHTNKAGGDPPHSFCHDDSGPISPQLRRSIDFIYEDLVRETKTPAIVYAVLLDGKPVYSRALGMVDVEKRRLATKDTRFRIASMTKSFTALAILKLRDQGKLRLSDPVSMHFSAAVHIKALSADSPELTIQHLLSQTGGLPQDDPWGDRLLDQSDEDFASLCERGIVPSTSVGSAFEYSNLGYALLGSVVTAVSGVPYSEYVKREILEPLGMLDTTFELSDIPSDKLAHGYRFEDGVWKREEMLHDGAFGPMGGLFTTLDDFAKYVAFHQSAWPPRSDADEHLTAVGVKRSTVREMHLPKTVDGIVMPAPPSSKQQAHPHPFVTCYAYGLRYNKDSKGNVWVRHAGGLPGFGSDYRFFLSPNRLSVVSFANKTYSNAAYLGNAQVAALLLESEEGRALRSASARHLPASPILAQRVGEVKAMIATSALSQTHTQAADKEGSFASNFFKDKSEGHWNAEIKALVSNSLGGEVVAETAVAATNNLRGVFFLRGKNGAVLRVHLTLTPEASPRVQELNVNVVASPPAGLHWLLRTPN